MARILPAHRAPARAGTFFRLCRSAPVAVVAVLLSAATARSCDPRLLPANTEIVFTINVKQFMESELVKPKHNDIKAIVQSSPLGALAIKYCKQMNFDPLSQLTRVTLSHTGNEALRPGDGFAVIEGVFDGKKFHETAAVVVEAFPETARMCYRYRGMPVYEFESFDKMVFCALVNNKSIVMAPNERTLKAAMTRAAGDKVEAVKVAHMLKAAKDKEIASLAVTGETAARLIRIARPNGVPGVDLSSIRGVTAGMTLARESKFHVTVASKDAKSATELAATGSLGLFAVRTLLGDAAKNPTLAPLIEVASTMSVAADGDRAVLTGTVSQQNLEKLLKWLAKT